MHLPCPPNHLGQNHEDLLAQGARKSTWLLGTKDNDSQRLFPPIPATFPANPRCLGVSAFPSSLLAQTGGSGGWLPCWPGEMVHLMHPAARARTVLPGTSSGNHAAETTWNNYLHFNKKHQEMVGSSTIPWLGWSLNLAKHRTKVSDDDWMISQRFFQQPQVLEKAQDVSQMPHEYISDLLEEIQTFVFQRRIRIKDWGGGQRSPPNLDEDRNGPLKSA